MFSVDNSQSLFRLDELEKGKIPYRAYTGTTASLAEDDINSEIWAAGADASTLSISDAFDSLAEIGTKVSVLWVGVGQPSISVTGSSNTINGGTTAIPISDRYQGVVITKVAAGAYIVSGAI